MHLRRGRVKWMMLLTAAACLAVCAMLGCGGGDAGTPASARPEYSAQAQAGSTSTLAKAQAEVAALQTPAGVDAKMLSELKQALLRALAAQDGAAKRTSDLPLGHDNQVPDLELQSVAGGSYLVWTYRNIGDYDQNGEVNAADLVPIAMYYLATSADGEPWLKERVADGDGNSEVNSADIVPIAEHFYVAMQGYKIYGTADHSQPWFPIGFMSLQDARDQQITGDEGRPLQFSFLIPQEPQYLSFYVAPTDNVSDGIGSVEVTISTEPAGITGVTPQSGISGELVEFSPQVTGSLLRYSWDFGGGADPNTSEFAHPLETLGAAGQYTVTVTVDNDFGDPAEYQFTLTVEEKQGDPVDVSFVSPMFGPDNNPGSLVTFTAEVTGTEPYTYHWNFGGGAIPNTSTDASPQVTLGNSGTYNASVTVDNAYGDPDQFEFTLSVN
jgi:hypothetical protein